MGAGGSDAEGVAVDCEEVMQMGSVRLIVPGTVVRLKPGVRRSAIDGVVMVDYDSRRGDLGVIEHIYRGHHRAILVSVQLCAPNFGRMTCRLKDLEVVKLETERKQEQQ